MVRGYSGYQRTGGETFYTLALGFVCGNGVRAFRPVRHASVRPPRPTQHDPDERRGLQYSPTRTGVRQCKPHTSSPPPCTMSLCKAMALRRPARRQGGSRAKSKHTWADSGFEDNLLRSDAVATFARCCTGETQTPANRAPHSAMLCKPLGGNFICIRYAKRSQPTSRM